MLDSLESTASSFDYFTGGFTWKLPSHQSRAVLLIRFDVGREFVSSCLLAQVGGVCRRVFGAICTNWPMGFAEIGANLWSAKGTCMFHFAFSRWHAKFYIKADSTEQTFRTKALERVPLEWCLRHYTKTPELEKKLTGIGWQYMYNGASRVFRGCMLLMASARLCKH